MTSLPPSLPQVKGGDAQQLMKLVFEFCVEFDVSLSLGLTLDHPLPKPSRHITTPPRLLQCLCPDSTSPTPLAPQHHPLAHEPLPNHGTTAHGGTAEAMQPRSGPRGAEPRASRQAGKAGRQGRHQQPQPKAPPRAHCLSTIVYRGARPSTDSCNRLRLTLLCLCLHNRRRRGTSRRRKRRLRSAP